jgi:class 3 adenylate cyclase
VVDDNALSRDLLSRRLERDGYVVSQAEDGLKALEVLENEPFDVVLLDVIMPKIDGVEVLRRLQSSGRLRGAPVIMLSAMDEVQQAVHCIELGAEDYLTKPFNPVLLRARISACLEKQRLSAEERRVSEQLRAALREVEEQRRLTESLLLNILPARISEELRTFGHVTPKYYDDVTIVFTDFVGFSVSTEEMAADEMVEMLHEYFTAFDGVVKAYGMEKLKTIGDSYMFLGGMPPRASSHPVDSVLACLELLHIVGEFQARFPTAWQIRIGMHTGPVIAGVVGVDKFAFDVWGETVNYSSRMESAGEPGRINLSERAYSRVKDFFECEPRGKILTKEQRAMDMYFVKGVHPKLMRDLSSTPPPLFLRRYRTYFERDPPAFPSHLEGTP